jgi:putative transposase
MLGIQASSAEDGAGWLAFFRDLVTRALSGVRLVTATPSLAGGRVLVVRTGRPGAPLTWLMLADMAPVALTIL